MSQSEESKMETENVIKEIRAIIDEVSERPNTYSIEEVISDCALQLGLILQNIERKLESRG